ncbi:rab-GTPase-TBC domain-containing protein [Microdochium trichocladiopsis]|uniref:Rab-GTPase-TBC domain-containing protein n=1 Tax=Microdochium trichocladiopsis TaxID=1682393 RepID=A0A9P9BN61_9PEZI|nr:rab-GTPase-TBC domain-containing protein [Microdochium trichocladiopsis]KAH7027371.1 rab-GTPase-TBC domain-containing protein [Microdochium trichocladiopsis]
MSSSKTSVASSVQSFASDDDNSVLADGAHFEEIGLDDDTITLSSAYGRELPASKASPPAHSYMSPLAAEVRANATRHSSHKQHPHAQTRELARPRSHRDITSTPKTRPPFAATQTHFRDTSTHGLTGGIGPDLFRGPNANRGLAIRSSSLSVHHRRRSPSPNVAPRSVSPSNPQTVMPTRRRSWQPHQDRKTAQELERECDDDDDDNIPDGFILDNVPLSPRPATERASSRASSATPSPQRSPERSPKERVRSIGNGTPAVAVASGSLRSPSWKSDISVNSSKSSGSTSGQGRAKSWSAAASYLNSEAKSLTDKLEEYADEMANKTSESGPKRISPKPRVKSALAELPPLRRTNIMIDPLPISKEKEAVLSRTRPSWLPPKDPAEEKKHIKEYQRMMVTSLEAEKKREALRKQKEEKKDNDANELIRIWEVNVLNRWDAAIRERSARELWWKGIAPRYRGTVWTRAIGNELSLSESSYEAALARACEVEERVAAGKATVEDERRAAWFTRIRADVEDKTWTDLKIFQRTGPLHESLVNVLRAYAMYRSDIGYLDGCSAVAAILLLNLPSPAVAFMALANTLNRPIPLSFQASDAGAKSSAYNLVLEMISKKAPQLYRHLTNTELSLDPELYLGEIFTTLFTQHLSLDECTRLWDVFTFEGDAILVRAAVALVLEKKIALLRCSTPAELRNALTERTIISEKGHDDAFMGRVRDAGKA